MDVLADAATSTEPLTNKRGNNVWLGVIVLMSIIAVIVYYTLLSDSFTPKYFNDAQIEAQFLKQRTPPLHIINHEIIKPDQVCLCPKCPPTDVSPGQSFEDSIGADPSNNDASVFEKLGEKKETEPKKLPTGQEVVDAAVESMVGDFLY